MAPALSGAGIGWDSWASGEAHVRGHRRASGTGRAICDVICPIVGATKSCAVELLHGGGDFYVRGHVFFVIAESLKHLQ